MSSIAARDCFCENNCTLGNFVKFDNLFLIGIHILDYFPECMIISVENVHQLVEKLCHFQNILLSC